VGEGEGEEQAKKADYVDAAADDEKYHQESSRHVEVVEEEKEGKGMDGRHSVDECVASLLIGQAALVVCFDKFPLLCLYTCFFPLLPPCFVNQRFWVVSVAVGKCYG
jgi:hypothetical protein